MLNLGQLNTIKAYIEHGQFEALDEYLSQVYGKQKVGQLEPLVMPKLWEVVNGNTKDHWLEIKDPEGWYYARVKWDGCIHFNRYFNMPKEMQEKEPEENRMDDYIHICSVDDMIQRLQALKAEALKHFGEDWDS